MWQRCPDMMDLDGKHTHKDEVSRPVSLSPSFFPSLSINLLAIRLCLCLSYMPALISSTVVQTHSPGEPKAKKEGLTQFRNQQGTLPRLDQCSCSQSLRSVHVLKCKLQNRTEWQEKGCSCPLDPSRLHWYSLSADSRHDVGPGKRLSYKFAPGFSNTHIGTRAHRCTYARRICAEK